MLAHNVLILSRYITIKEIILAGQYKEKEGVGEDSI